MAEHDDKKLTAPTAATINPVTPVLKASVTPLKERTTITPTKPGDQTIQPIIQDPTVSISNVSSAEQLARTATAGDNFVKEPQPASTESFIGQGAGEPPDEDVPVPSGDGTGPAVPDQPIVDTPLQNPDAPASSTGSDADQALARQDVTATINDALSNPRQFIDEHGGTQVYTAGVVTEDELLAAAERVEAQTLAGAETGESAEAVGVRDFEASLLDPDSMTSAFEELQKTSPMQAASMAKQMEGLLAGIENGEIPVWARPAAAQVERQLAARGISASSVGRDALFNSIIQAAMPIAQQDAQFQQDANKTNFTANVQAIMSDVGMENATKQFNATSKNQRNQFLTQITAQVDSQNAARADNMSQFNASQGNDFTKFTASLDQQRQTFNAQMQQQVLQSNVAWRRQVNQSNTAGVNAVNQANAQNAFNLSNKSISMLWQEMRDEAHWDFQADEAEKDRKNQLQATILQNESAATALAGNDANAFIDGLGSLTDFLSTFD